VRTVSAASTPPCIFCSIVRGDVPAQIILRSRDAVAFLDTRPVFKGHVLVVPPAHRMTLADLLPAELPGYFATVQRVARAVEKGTAADGSFVALNNVVSQSVPHLHTHVVPRRKKDGLRGFFWPRMKYDSDLEAEEIATRISTALE
jgi:histidine triad (HIT) family protein